MNTRKLNLITEATTAFPGVSINDAILLFLRNRYSSDQGLSDLIARYLYQPSIFAYNFDGVDDYAVLPYRAINPDGDNSFEFWAPPTLSGVAQTIISQNISATTGSREFQLYVSTGGFLEVFWGGSVTILLTSAQGYEESRKYFVSFVGNIFTVSKDTSSNIVNSGGFTRGAAREPTAQTIIGARSNGAGLYSIFYRGIQRDIKINGTLWRMADRNQAIQLPEPSGLGAELITPTVLENPFSKGTQWTYLGGGRWQYVGDGSLDRLVFLRDQDHPPSGLLEFEIESISSGGILATTFLVNTAYQFNSVGVKRIFYTQQASVGYLTFNRASGTVFSCIIKNISFKPLGTCNPMTLVNVTSDRWQEVPQ